MSRERLLIGCLACLASLFASAQGTERLEVADAETGVRVAVDERDDLPALRIHVAGQAESDPGIFVLFPEHVTARERDQAEPRQLYLFRPGRQSGRPAWRRDGRSLEYRLDIAPGVTMLARATLEADGIRYTYRFENRSATAYAKMQAVTDPRMESPAFRDVRLERSYVHHRDGFDLLASETPGRTTMTLDQWLPNRHRVPYTWPVDHERVARQSDGVTWYNKSRAVDEPFIATRSVDGRWIMATFSYDPGNVWSNPELTCQHADPEVALDPGQTRAYELKTLLFRGTLDEVLTKVKAQRPAMKP